MQDELGLERSYDPERSREYMVADKVEVIDKEKKVELPKGPDKVTIIYVFCEELSQGISFKLLNDEIMGDILSGTMPDGIFGGYGDQLVTWDDEVNGTIKGPVDNETSLLVHKKNNDILYKENQTFTVDEYTVMVSYTNFAKLFYKTTVEQEGKGIKIFDLNSRVKNGLQKREVNENIGSKSDDGNTIESEDNEIFKSDYKPDYPIDATRITEVPKSFNESLEKLGTFGNQKDNTINSYEESNKESYKPDYSFVHEGIPIDLSNYHKKKEDKTNIGNSTNSYDYFDNYDESSGKHR